MPSKQEFEELQTALARAEAKVTSLNEILGAIVRLASPETTPEKVKSVIEDLTKAEATAARYEALLAEKDLAYNTLSTAYDQQKKPGVQMSDFLVVLDGLTRANSLLFKVGARLHASHLPEVDDLAKVETLARGLVKP